VKDKYARIGAYVNPMSPSELAAFIRKEQEMWAADRAEGHRQARPLISPHSTQSSGHDSSLRPQP
jgi:hypothetical protein